MKLSEISTDKGFAIIAQITPPMGRIISNDAVKSFVNSYGGKQITWALGLKAILELSPILFVDGKDDLLKVISAMTEKKRSEILQQSCTKTIKDLVNIYNDFKDDEELIELFTLSANTEPVAFSVPSQVQPAQSAVTE
jgi:hypothetical protein